MLLIHRKLTVNMNSLKFYQQRILKSYSCKRKNKKTSLCLIYKHWEVIVEFIEDVVMQNKGIC